MNKFIDKVLKISPSTSTNTGPKMPVSKFSNPSTSGNQDFTVSTKISNLQVGNFVNSSPGYYAAPHLGKDGVVLGNSKGGGKK